jgi:trans-2,3-dihydro-3-hydroxyanthranilate isomerase
MRKLHYRLVDVFTDRAFGGNPLAVFLDGQGISSEVMQAIANELHLSETTFVLPPEDPQNTYHVRIFTPATELPMAGHPTVGTAFTLAYEHMLELRGTETTIRFEEGVGVIPVTLKQRDDNQLFIQMRQPLPTFGPNYADRRSIAEMLSLEEDALEADLPIEVVSCGVPFLFVPVKNLAAMRAIRFRNDVWERALGGFATSDVFVFTREAETSEGTVHSRMFAPSMGIAEDPATGAASGPLGCYLVSHGLVSATPRVALVSEQGFEMGRPSLIHIEIEQSQGQITGVYVGGQCYYMGEGIIELQ